MKNKTIRKIWAIRCLMVVLLINTASITKVTAQNTMGTDFWVSFLYLSSIYFEGEDVFSIVACGPRSCTCTVTNPRTNWSQTFNVEANNSTTIIIPQEQAYTHNTFGNASNTGLHVVSSDTISLYAVHSVYQLYCSCYLELEATNVLPTHSLGSDYIIQTYSTPVFDPYDPDIIDFSEFLILATESSTEINAVLPCDFYGHPANQPFTIYLAKGQCCQIGKRGNNDSFSGSRLSVANDKKIAVFAGNSCAFLPNGYMGPGHIVEQMMPITNWGQHFVITGSMLRLYDRIRVTALNDNCQIKKNGILLTTINARETYEFEITSNEPSSYIETSEPAMVYLYFTSSCYGNQTNGHPSMVIINPIEQKISNVTFCTINLEQIEHHYLNVVTAADKVSGMRLDGNSIASYFQTVSGNADYAFARIPLNPGVHTLNNQNGGFVAHVYGIGGYGPIYAYSVGSMVKNLTPKMLVDGQITSDFPNGFDVCVNDLVNFDLNLSFDLSQANWTFGDGETGLGCPVSHSYESPGDYMVSCDVYKTWNGQNVLATTLTTELHVHGSYQEEIDETNCDSYTWMGQTYTQSGDYTYQGQTIYGCDSIATLHLTINHSDTTFLDISACNEYEWYGTTLSESGVYTHLEQTIAGCDSLLTLHLTIGQDKVHPIEQEETCEDSFTWHGQHYSHSGVYYDTIAGTSGCNEIYTLDLTLKEGYSINLSETACDRYPWLSVPNGYLTESGYYSFEGQTQDGCDSIVELNLTVNHTPGLMIDGPSQVAMTTDLGGIYNYYALDSIGVEPCTVTWSCSNPNWVIFPVDDTYMCRIAPTTLGTATLTAVTHCETGCDTASSIEINSTYYGIEENEEDRVHLFPNPTNSQVTIQVHQITQVRILDNYGQVVKIITFQGEETMTIDVSDLSQNVYFVEITTANGCTVKHLIVLK